MPSAPFRVLVSDDSDEWLGIAEEQLSPIPGLILRTAASPAESIAKIGEEVFHLAFVDLEQRGSAAGGREVIHHLRRCAPSCRRLVMTRFSEKYAHDLISLAAPIPAAASPLRTVDPLVHGMIDKGRANANFFEHYALPALESWREREFDAAGRDSVESSIALRRKRIPDLRASPTAIADELEFLLRRIFGGLIGIAGQHRLSRIDVSLFTGGFSSAVVFSALPQVGFDATGRPITGNACVVKVGPTAEIQQEASRYDKVVRYGVALENRVELLSVAYADALGAICYSFAGGTSVKPTSVDEALARDDFDLVNGALSALFDPTNQRWYSVVTPSISLSEFFQQEYKFQVHEGVQQIRDWIKKRARSGKTRDFISTDGERVSLAGLEISLPRDDLAGHPTLLRRQPSCLVHGDLHGGNIMVDASGRTSMIDYRQAGSGPRLLDIASLQSTIRLHDPAVRLGANTAEHVALLAKRRFRDELVVKDALGRGRRPADAPVWEQLAYRLNDAISDNFPDVTAGEYLGTNILVALRIASLAHIDDARRLRLLSWVDALTRSLDEG